MVKRPTQLRTPCFNGEERGLFFELLVMRVYWRQPRDMGLAGGRDSMDEKDPMVE